MFNELLIYYYFLCKLHSQFTNLIFQLFIFAGQAPIEFVKDMQKADS